MAKSSFELKVLSINLTMDGFIAISLSKSIFTKSIGLYLRPFIAEDKQKEHLYGQPLCAS